MSQQSRGGFWRSFERREFSKSLEEASLKEGKMGGEDRLGITFKKGIIIVNAITMRIREEERTLLRWRPGSALSLCASGWCVATSWPSEPQIPLRVYVLLGRLSIFVFVPLSLWFIQTKFHQFPPPLCFPLLLFSRVIFKSRYLSRYLNVEI